MSRIPPLGAGTSVIRTSGTRGKYLGRQGVILRANTTKGRYLVDWIADAEGSRIPVVRSWVAYRSVSPF